MGYYLTLTSTLRLVFDLAFFFNFFLSNSSFSKRVTLYVLLCHSKSNNDYIRKIQRPAVVQFWNHKQNLPVQELVKLGTYLWLIWWEFWHFNIPIVCTDLNSCTHQLIYSQTAKCNLLLSYTALETWTHWLGYLKEVQLWQRFRRYLDLQISSLVDSLKKTNAFLVHVICATETVTIKGVYIKAFTKRKMASNVFS